MSSISDTSVWIKFFTEAGIPVGDATNYAITFTDNRIKTDMLLDLNREYLKDMGITVMGDVIAILKHAKVYSGQLSRQKVLQATPATAPASATQEAPTQPTVGTKKSTPATRMLEHYVRKEAPPPSPPTTSSSLPQSLSSRLTSGGTKRSLEDDDSGNSGKRSSVSVFNRLGDNSVTSTTTDNPKITITMHGKDVTLRSPPAMDTSSKKPASVFGRLIFNEDSDTSSSERDVDIGKPLEYQGILKYTTKEGNEKAASSKKQLGSNGPASTSKQLGSSVTSKQLGSSVTNKQLGSSSSTLTKKQLGSNGSASTKTQLGRSVTSKQLGSSVTSKQLGSSGSATTMKADTTTSGIKSRLGMQNSGGSAAHSSAGIFAKETEEAMKVTKPSLKAIDSPASSLKNNKAVGTTKAKTSPAAVTMPKSQLIGRTVATATATSSSVPPPGAKKYVKKIVKVNKKTGKIVSEEMVPLKTDVFSRLGN